MENKFEKSLGPETIGRNVRINAIFVRHGEKVLSAETAETGLTEGGRKMAADFGESLNGKAAIKAYSSDTARTIETATLAINNSPTEHKLSLRIRDDLEAIYDEKGPFMQSLFALKRTIMGTDFKNLPPDEQKRRLYEYYSKQNDLYLNHGDTRPDANTQSPAETAAKIAGMVETYIKMADRLKSGSDVDLINATHDWAIGAFLKEVMIRKIDGKDVKGFNSVSDIGGPIGYTDHFDVRISTDGDGNKTVELEFRGQNCKMDANRFRELVEMSKAVKTQKT